MCYEFSEQNYGCKEAGPRTRKKGNSISYSDRWVVVVVVVDDVVVVDVVVVAVDAQIWVMIVSDAMRQPL